MKAIAAYFCELAAQQRDFGTEPPARHAEDLAAIAESETNQGVIAEVVEDGVVLRHTLPVPGADILAEAEPDDQAEMAEVPPESVSDEFADDGVGPVGEPGEVAEFGMSDSQEASDANAESASGDNETNQAADPMSDAAVVLSALETASPVLEDAPEEVAEPLSVSGPDAFDLRTADLPADNNAFSLPPMSGDAANDVPDAVANKLDRIRSALARAVGPSLEASRNQVQEPDDAESGSLEAAEEELHGANEPASFMETESGDEIAAPDFSEEVAPEHDGSPVYEETAEAPVMPEEPLAAETDVTSPIENELDAAQASEVLNDVEPEMGEVAAELEEPEVETTEPEQ
ncbi:MAG: hypothetical protein AAFY60_20700, partial [Myxococcota bacterium]